MKLLLELLLVLPAQNVFINSLFVMSFGYVISTHNSVFVSC